MQRKDKIWGYQNGGHPKWGRQNSKFLTTHTKHSGVGDGGARRALLPPPPPPFPR